MEKHWPLCSMPPSPCSLPARVACPHPAAPPLLAQPAPATPPCTRGSPLTLLPASRGSAAPPLPARLALAAPPYRRGSARGRRRRASPPARQTRG